MKIKLRYYCLKTAENFQVNSSLECLLERAEKIYAFLTDKSDKVVYSFKQLSEPRQGKIPVVADSVESIKAFCFDEDLSLNGFNRVYFWVTKIKDLEDIVFDDYIILASTSNDEHKFKIEPGLYDYLRKQLEAKSQSKK